jgi:hypothetical protein
MKERVIHLNATVCYLKKDNQVLMLKFNKKWGAKYMHHLGENLKQEKHH